MLLDLIINIKINASKQAPAGDLFSPLQGDHRPLNAHDRPSRGRLPGYASHADFRVIYKSIIQGKDLGWWAKLSAA